jgi:CRP-like cAMP-binding protein
MRSVRPRGRRSAPPVSDDGADLDETGRRLASRLQRYGDHHDLNAGEVLTREGTVARQTFFILDGQAEVTVRGQVVAEIGPGAFVGEMATLEGTTRSATVRAKTDVAVLVLGPRAISDALGDAVVVRAMSRQLATRVRDLDNRLAAELSAP